MGIILISINTSAKLINLNFPKTYIKMEHETETLYLQKYVGIPHTTTRYSASLNIPNAFNVFIITSIYHKSCTFYVQDMVSATFFVINKISISYRKILIILNSRHQIHIKRTTRIEISNVRYIHTWLYYVYFSDIQFDQTLKDTTKLIKNIFQ